MSSHIPIVSIVVPNYNHARYLPQRIESILNQSFTDFEIFLLDDCSQDNSREVINRYVALDARIVPVFNEQNSGGVFKQWHRGLSLARGQYVWIAESDDFADPTFLEELVLLLEENSTLAFAYSNSWIVDENSKIDGTTADWKREYFATDHWDSDFTVSGKDELQTYLSHYCTVNNASAVLFRRSSIEAAGGVDTSFRYAGDWLMYIKLCVQNNIAYKAACLSYYREHSVNTSKKSDADGSQIFERLKCLAFLYKTRILGNYFQQSLLHRSSEEYFSLVYKMLRVNRQPSELRNFVYKLIRFDLNFFLRIQTDAVKLWFKSK